jgi:hypothetical protein
MKVPGGQIVQVSNIPDGIVLARDRDLAGRERQYYVRLVLLMVLPAIVLLALFNVFGQRPATLTSTGGGASLQVYAPSRVRSGLIFQSRFHVTAQRDIKDARLVLGPGWFESMSINSIEPQPLNEASANGSVSLELGHVPAGESYVLWIYFQVNPTNVGHRAAPVTLYDGSQRLLGIDRTVTVIP